MKPPSAYIVYFSPAGATRQVAEAIADETFRANCRVVKVDLSRQGAADAGQVQTRIGKGDILFLGSPVYANHPVPAVMDFLSGVTDNTGAYAAPFVTYGMVSSGVALHEMAKLMDQKGLIVLGGIKVTARHSMLWNVAEPLGKGRPDEQDMVEVGRFARKVVEKAAGGGPPLPLDALNYQRAEVQEKAKGAGLHAMKPLLLPFDVNAGLCTQCGLCVGSCPTANITVESGPVFADRCVLCFNCVRVCEPGAISSKVLPFIEPELQKRMGFFNEPPQTVTIV